MAADKDAPRRSGPTELHRRQRVKNWTVLAILVALVVMVYVISILRMKAGQ